MITSLLWCYTFQLVFSVIIKHSNIQSCCLIWEGGNWWYIILQCTISRLQIYSFFEVEYIYKYIYIYISVCVCSVIRFYYLTISHASNYNWKSYIMINVIRTTLGNIRTETCRANVGAVAGSIIMILISVVNMDRGDFVLFKNAHVVSVMLCIGTDATLHSCKLAAIQKVDIHGIDNIRWIPGQLIGLYYTTSQRRFNRDIYIMRNADLILEIKTAYSKQWISHHTWVGNGIFVTVFQHICDQYNTRIINFYWTG